VLSFTTLTVVAQKKESFPKRLIKCATDEAIEANFRLHPELRAAFDKKNQETFNKGNAAAKISSLTAPVTIPVVVHVVLSDPNIITEQDVDYFLDRLNRDYSGFNPDSANAVAFYPVRGHSLIRFVRAKTSPTGVYTTGVERKVGTTGIAGGTYQGLKHASTATGGLDPWDITKYYNIWVGNGVGTTGILGIAPTIGVGNATETTTSAVGIDGVCVDYTAFAHGCYSDPAYNLGRTAVHEIGHNFGLYHTHSGCNAGADFQQPAPAGQTLPANLVGAAADDTPGEAAPHYGCPGGVATPDCSAANTPNPPGRMYQNYMAYTDDACMTMFTKQQVERMHYMLETYRPGYLTTTAGNYPAGFPVLDAGVMTFVSPGGSDVNGLTCPLTSYATPSCPGSFVPRVSLTNFGSTTITSVTVSVTVGAAAPVTQTFTGLNLATYKSTTLQFAAQNFPTGTYAVTFNIVSVNAVPDTYTTNNSIAKTFTIGNSATVPLIATFETASATLPISNIAPFTIYNPDGDFSWEKGNTGYQSTSAAVIRYYVNGALGRIDDIRSPSFAPGVVDSVIIEFDYAYRQYLGPPVAIDSLSVLFSKDCGTSFAYTSFRRGGASLATVTGTGQLTAPTAAQWRRAHISLGGNDINTSNMIIAFRAKGDFGNNIWIDNININVLNKANRDLALAAIVTPVGNVCANSVSPQVVVSNKGIDTVTSFRVGYRINNGTIVNQTFTQQLLPNAAVTLTLANATAIPVGGNTITTFVTDVVSRTGTGDQRTGNDTLALRPFTVVNYTATLPFTQGFEATTFPPANWSIINGGDPNTWVRAAVGKNNIGSAFIDNYNFNTIGDADILQTPYVNTGIADSVRITFDYAHKYYPGSFDSLKVKLSNDCGNNFSVVFNKSSSQLATAGASTADYTSPIISDWRNATVSFPVFGGIVAQFENTNDYGNNIFIDNINMKGVYKRDVELTSINTFLICPPSAVPSVTVTNVGIDTIKGLKVAYSIDNGAVLTSTFTNLNLVKTQSLSLNLTTISGLAFGNHTIKVYTFDPVTTAGIGDMYTLNDTLSKVIISIPTTSEPIAEGFESTTFPPTGWTVVNPDGGLTWQKTTIAARSGGASVYINGFKDSINNSKDDLYTPVMTYATADSLSLNFDVAATTYSYPGSAEVPMDTLEVMLSNDCGLTYTSLYKKWGAELQTIGNANQPQTEEFFPNSARYWRNESIDLTAWVARSPILLMFRNTNNFKNNNIFLDNINVKTKTLPAILKSQGYTIYPTPFSTTFTIQHYLAPRDLRSMGVFNSVGQMVVTQNFGSNGASSMINVDMSHFANGMYTVVLYYATKTVSQKIIKGR